eukprot:329848-Rhodomonas_salina.3
MICAGNFRKLVQSRGLEEHWLMPKTEAVSNACRVTWCGISRSKAAEFRWTSGPCVSFDCARRLKPVFSGKYKCEREWDLNISLAQARPNVNAVAPLAGASVLLLRSSLSQAALPRIP